MKKYIAISVLALLFAQPASAANQPSFEIVSYCTNDITKAYWGIENNENVTIKVDVSEGQKPPRGTRVTLSHAIEAGRTYKFTTDVSEGSDRDKLFVIASFYDNSGTPADKSENPNGNICGSEDEEDDSDTDRKVKESPARKEKKTPATARKVYTEKKEVEDAATIQRMQEQIALLTALIQQLMKEKGMVIQNPVQ